MNDKGNFVIRVYGIVISSGKRVLLSDEFRLGMRMTKFPGGGLMFGEGTKDGLIREFKEECNGQEITNIQHFYTTDYYQKALFYENHQLLSIYYLVDLKTPVKFNISDIPFDFPSDQNGNQSFRWACLDDLKDVDITFPVDKIVLNMLKSNFYKL